MKALLLLLAVAACLSADSLDLVRAEPNLEKRAEKALKASETSFAVARKAAQEARLEDETKALGEVRAAIELAMQSLKASGKDPRRSPKYFKKAEITIRKLMRQLGDLEFSKGVDERKPITDLIAYLRGEHDEILVGIMTKKK